jgi:hypothetical protein
VLPIDSNKWNQGDTVVQQRTEKFYLVLENQFSLYKPQFINTMIFHILNLSRDISRFLMNSEIETHNSLIYMRKLILIHKKNCLCVEKDKL